MKLSTVVALLALFGAVGAFGQEVSPHVVASSGGESTAGDVTIMWTVGEIAVTTLTNSSGYITQGFHQPPRETTGAPFEVLADDAFRIWPNPITEELFAGVGESARSIETLELLDMVGRVVVSTEGMPGAGEVRVDVADVPSGTYVVRVTSGEQRWSRVVTVQR